MSRGPIFGVVKGNSVELPEGHGLREGERVEVLERVPDFRAKYGLMVGDSLNLAIAEGNSVVDIASIEANSLGAEKFAIWRLDDLR